MFTRTFSLTFNMAATSSKKGKKKGKTVNLVDFLADTSSPAKEGTNVVTVKPSTNWADTMDEEDENGYSGPVQRIALPSAPRSALQEVDLSKVPDNAPFTAYVGNLSYDVDEEVMENFFSKMSIDKVRLVRDQGRLKGYGYVEFTDKQSLIDALGLNNETLMARKIKIDIAGQAHERSGGYGDRDGDRRMNSQISGEGDADDDWRGTAMTSARERQSSGFGQRDGGFQSRRGGFDSRDGGFGYRRDDRTPGPADEEETWSRGGYTERNGERDNEFGSRRGYSERYEPARSYDDRRGGYDDRRGGYDNRRGGYDDRRGGYDDRRGGYDDRRGGYDDRRGGYDDRRGGYNDRRGGYDERRGRYDDRRDGYSDHRGGGYDDRRGYSDRRGYDEGPRRGYDERRGSYEDGSQRYDERPSGGERPRLNLQPRSKQGEDESGSSPGGRPKLQLAPRSKPVEENADTEDQHAKPSIFGDAKPVDTAAKEREIEERLMRQHHKSAEVSQTDNPRTTVGSSFGSRDIRENVERRIYNGTDNSVVSEQSENEHSKEPAAPAPKRADIFGAAKPVDTASREREIEERLLREREKTRTTSEGDDDGGRRHTSHKELHQNRDTDPSHPPRGSRDQPKKKEKKERALPQSIEDMPTYEPDKKGKDLAISNKFASLLGDDDDGDNSVGED